MTCAILVCGAHTRVRTDPHGSGGLFEQILLSETTSRRFVATEDHTEAQLRGCKRRPDRVGNKQIHVIDRERWGQVDCGE